MWSKMKNREYRKLDNTFHDHAVTFKHSRTGNFSCLRNLYSQQLTVAKDLNITLIIDDPQSQNKTRFFKKQLEKATRLRVL